MGDLLRIRRVEEPERTVRIDNLRRGSLIPPDLPTLPAGADGQGAPALAADALPRMRAIGEEECDAAQARGETGYPAMWAADRLEVIEDCLGWLESERDESLTATLPLGASEARFGPRQPGTGRAPSHRMSRSRSRSPAVR